MAKSIKPKNNTYWDSSAVSHNKIPLDSYINNHLEFFNDTSASDIKDLIKKKLDYVVAQTQNENNSMIFLNGGWQYHNYFCGIGARIGKTCYQVMLFNQEYIYIGRYINGTYYYYGIQCTAL